MARDGQQTSGQTPGQRDKAKTMSPWLRRHKTRLPELTDGRNRVILRSLDLTHYQRVTESTDLSRPPGVITPWFLCNTPNMYTTKGGY